MIFVICWIPVFVVFAGCSFVSPQPGIARSDSSFQSAKVVGKLKSDEITESSGVAASRCQSNVLWTHNDSGDDAFVYAFTMSGDSLGTWKVQNAENNDWEDIAAYKDKAGKCFLYIGEIGDNKAKRPEHAVYRIPEPVIVPAAVGSSRKGPLQTANAEVIRFSYPDVDQDCETLMVHPKSGDIYIVTKRVSGPAAIYRIDGAFDSSEVQKAMSIGELSVLAVPNGFLTGGDISPDGLRLIICDYTQAYEYTLPKLAANFDEIWKQEPERVDLGKRKGGESICYNVDGTSLFATSEGKHSPVIEVRRK